MMTAVAASGGVDKGVPAFTPSSTPQLEGDYKTWLCALLPKHFRGKDQFAEHHEDFWDWIWNVERAQQPEKPAFLAIWNRGGSKSTQAEGAVVAVGARKKRKYVLYVCRTQKQADDHVRAVESMMLSSNVADAYPEMANPQVKEVGNHKVRTGWNHARLTTASGFTIAAFGVDSAMRGVRIEDYRPDMIVLDDIDDVKDSVGVVDNLVAQIGASILPTASPHCIYVFVQNLIHRDSVINRILTRKCDLLSKRIESGPIPAVYNPTYERRNEEWFITGGTPSWVGMPLSECQAKLNAWGKDFWDREAQHDIEKPYDDAIYQSYDPVYHVITQSEFRRYFESHDVVCHDRNGDFRIPKTGHIVMAQDWGNTFAHPTANRWAWRPAENMPLKDSVFLYREMVWPTFPKKEDDERRHPSPLKLGKAINEVEMDWEEGPRVKWRLASHERPEIVEAYISDMKVAGMKPLKFEQIDTAEAKEGILHMQSFLTIIEDEFHPFRAFPDGHPQAGESLPGRPRVYFVVADGQGELYFEPKTSKIMVRPAIDEAGQARTRFEYPNYRKPDTAKGTETSVIPKRDDDMADVDRAIAGRLFPSIQKLTDRERIEHTMPKRFRESQMAATAELETEAQSMGRYQAYHEANHKLQQAKKPTNFRDRINKKYGIKRR
jgi:hypothetical protein